jgi:hypothetical protein
MESASRSVTRSSTQLVSSPTPGSAHALHIGPRDWPESNCYIDVWIELLHGYGLCVEASLGFTLASDFEGDQWTFYKPPHADLERLYGIRVEELTLYRSLLDQAVEQVSRRRVVLVEADAYYLPDTEGLDYRKNHTKTTIGIHEIDAENRRLDYFHNRGSHRLDGADFEGVLRLDPRPTPEMLPPYCEIAKLDRLQRLEPARLGEICVDLARRHFERRPAANPIEAYAREADRHMREVIDAGGDAYDLYAFAAIRQCGSGYAFTADHLRWLASLGIAPVATSNAAESFQEISARASKLIMKMARIAHSGRLRDLGEDFRAMAEAWDRGMNTLEAGLFR